MGKIFWLASYPKSGNTWLRVLLTNYRRQEDTPADINRLEGGPIASARLWFDEWVGVEASALDDSTIERLRPEVYRCLSRENQETLYMKVHDSWKCTDQDEALFPADITAGVLYIMRNPLDLAASCAHHWGVSLMQSVENLCKPDFTLARSLGGMADQLQQVLYSWSGHVHSWLDTSGLPIHLVRYEDLSRDPEAIFAAVVRFCDLPWDESRVRQAVLFANFTELQRQEQRVGFRERSVSAPGPFFRRGQVGSWREELPADLVLRLIDAHRENMYRFGYLDKYGQPV